MKKILMMIVMLAMILPTFGQKLNSRGEKMVSSVYVYGFYRGEMFVSSIYDFEYDQSGNLLVVTYTYPQCKSTTTIRRDGNTLTYELRRGSGGGYYDSALYSLNKEGHVISEKLYYDMSGTEWDCVYDLVEYEYTYDRYLNCCVLSKCSKSQWRAYKDQEIFLCDDEYDVIYFNITDKEIQRYSVFIVDGEESRGSSKKFLCGNITNDTNINLFGFISNCGIRDELFKTEWVPFYVRKLPINLLNRHDNSVCRQYDYTYYEGNIVCITDVIVQSDGEYYPQSVVKINYVEEDDDE